MNTVARFFVASLCALSSLIAQDDEFVSIVILSPRVGPTIDAAERDRFQIFSHVKYYDSVRVYCTAKGVHFVRLYQTSPDGDSLTTDTPVQKDYLERMADQIEHFELLQEGRYELGDEPVSLGYALLKTSEQPIQIVHAHPAYLSTSGDLPLSPQVSELLIDTYPNIGLVMFGLSSYSPDLQLLGSRLGEDLSFSPLYWFGLRLRATENIGATLHTGFAPGQGSMVIGTLDLQMAVPGANWLRPYLSGGYGHSRFEPEPNGYVIKIASSGIVAGGGAEVMIARYFSLSAGAQYFFSKPFTESYSNTSVTVDLSGFMVALRGTFYL